MTKFSYPKDGIYRYCKSHIDSCSKNLSRAVECCNFDIPNDFPYKEYLYGLGGILREYYSRINNIDSKIQKSNSNLDSLSSDLLNSVNKMTNMKIKERDRMIY